MDLDGWVVGEFLVAWYALLDERAQCGLIDLEQLI